MRTDRRRMLCMAGYVPLQFIENPGWAFILTGFHATETMSMKVDIKCNEISNNNVFAGSDLFYLGNGSTYETLFVLFGNANMSTSKTSINFRHIYELGKGVGLKIDGVLISKDKNTLKRFTSEREISIAGSKLPSGKLLSFKSTIYEFWLYDNGVEIMHLIPVKKVSNGEVGMLDLVTKKFFTSYTGVKFIGGVESCKFVQMPLLAERRVA